MRLNAIGIIAIAAVILGVSALGVERGRRNTRTVHTLLRDAPDVIVGTRVTYLGVDVGVVQRLRLMNGGVAIDADIHRGDAPMRARDSMRVGVARTVDYDGSRVPAGKATIEIVPGPPSARALASGDTLPPALPRGLTIAPIVDPVRLRDSLANLVRHLRADSAELERRLRAPRAR
ncbi:MAG: MlaD family protein [Gemmatimonadaceae bacterium]